MALKVHELVTEVPAKREDATRFEVVPSKMYPAALSDLRDAVEAKRSVDGALMLYRNAAARLPDDAWDLALIPRDEVADEDLMVRATALELARVWFTELLHRSIGNAQMEIHILKNDDWKIQ